MSLPSKAGEHRPFKIIISPVNNAFITNYFPSIKNITVNVERNLDFVTTKFQTDFQMPLSLTHTHTQL